MLNPLLGCRGHIALTGGWSLKIRRCSLKDESADSFVAVHSLSWWVLTFHTCVHDVFFKCVINRIESSSLKVSCLMCSFRSQDLAWWNLLRHSPLPALLLASPSTVIVTGSGSGSFQETNWSGWATYTTVVALTTTHLSKVESLSLETHPRTSSSCSWILWLLRTQPHITVQDTVWGL